MEHEELSARTALDPAIQAAALALGTAVAKQLQNLTSAERRHIAADREAGAAVAAFSAAPE